MSNCPKCTSASVVAWFIQARSLINHSGRAQIETEFVTSNQYDFFWQHVAAKDHLLKHCPECQYRWREATADEVKP